MRKLASFEDPERARALSETLYAARIDSDVRQDGSVWVLSEHDVPRAEAVLREFTARSGGHANQLRTLAQNARTHPVTYALFAICVLVWFVTEVLDHPELVQRLLIASFDLHASPMHDLARGQLWRLITPIFVHFGPIHLFLNLSMLASVGGVMERVQGSPRYALFVAWTAAVSNIAELVFGAGTGFGGISGVLFAFVGYLWLRSRADPGSGLHVPPSFVGFAVVWMALGFSGLMDRYVRMANYCHLGGFVAGAAAGYVAAVRARRRAQVGGVW